MKKILIIGAGASGLVSAILLKQKEPKIDVIVAEKNEIPGRRLRATGNGHCNLSNAALNPSVFNNPTFVRKVGGEKPLESIISILSSLGIPFIKKGDLYYPLNYSAPETADYLFDLAVSLGVRFSFKTNGLDLLETDTFDFVLFACGGSASSKLGDNQEANAFLKKKGIELKNASPRLCPLKTKENTKGLDGLRHKCDLSLFIDKKKIYSEQGEILFKKDGVSGIAVFNCASKIGWSKGKDALIEVDLFEDRNEAELASVIYEQYKLLGMKGLNIVLEEPYWNYLLQKLNIASNKPLKADDFQVIAHTLKHMVFHISGMYDLSSSQVSGGGVDVYEVNEDLSLSSKPNYYILGEFLDIDGLCGGFNLSWALLSAFKAVQSILEK